jgi:hypothetical protein
MVVGFITYLCTQYVSPLTLWVRIPLRRGVLDTTLCDKICQLLAGGRWFSPGTPVSSTNKTDRHDLTEILLKVALNNITLTRIHGHLLFSKPRKLISQNLNQLTVIQSSIFVVVFFSQNIILQLIQVHREIDLMETMEVKYFLKLFLNRTTL